MDGKIYWIGWLYEIVSLISIIAIVLKNQKYPKGAADFLTAGRAAGGDGVDKLQGSCRSAGITPG